jgi:hypothetical protein
VVFKPQDGYKQLQIIPHVPACRCGKSGESLPSIQTMRLVSQDPEEDARLEAEYFARNQKVSRMLEEKGSEWLATNLRSPR